tara:strand:+ start:579 stop:926 length:348 start_codon:yes stop_codon:yes gene_type:complete
MEEILKKISGLKEELFKLEQELLEVNDGYKYRVTIRSYGSMSTVEFNNEHGVHNIVDDYPDGENGLLDILTTNPTLETRDYGSVTIKVVKADAWDRQLSPKEVSRTEGILKFMKD